MLSEGPFPRDYVVNVVNPADASVVFGYAISKNKKDDIKACLGRIQPLGNYMIYIQFKPAAISFSKNEYLVGSLLAMAFVGFIVFRSVKPRRPSSDSRNKGLLRLGSMSFDAEPRKLRINAKAIDLNRTEAGAFHIFDLSPNEAKERDRLQK